MSDSVHKRHAFLLCGVTFYTGLDLRAVLVLLGGAHRHISAILKFMYSWYMHCRVSYRIFGWRGNWVGH